MNASLGAAYARLKGKQRLRRQNEALRSENERGLRYVLAKLGTYYFGWIYNDLRFGRKKSIHLGKLDLTDRAAIYLIFPDKGLLASHLDSLRYLKHKGYTPIVVSNHPLTRAERLRLGEYAHLVIVRHNFGYDFGGYRDAVLALADKLSGLKYLAILNDSSWFPVTPEADWLGDAEAKGLDYVGAASHFAFPMTAPEEFRSVDWTYSHKHPFFHYTSFALLIGAEILKREDFLNFWKFFPMSNIKRLVIRRGEAGLTQWVIRKGFTHGETADLAGLAKEIRAMKPSDLREVLACMPINFGEDFLKETSQNLCADPNACPEDMANLILTSVQRQGVSYALGRVLIERFGFSFLKKSPLWLSADSSRQMLEFVDTLEGEIGAHIRSEAVASAQLAPEAEAALP
jgi:hypothetical protein